MNKHDDKAVAPRPRRGRKPKNKAFVDFTVADAIPEYEAKRAEYAKAEQAEKTKARLTGEIRPQIRKPAFLAAADAMGSVRKELGNISDKRLLNLMSEFRHPKDAQSDAESIEIAPDPFDSPDHDKKPAK